MGRQPRLRHDFVFEVGMAISDRIDGKPVYDRARCVRCGACGMGCPSGALHLEPVSEEEWFHVPSSFTEWEERRLEYLAATQC